VFHPKREVPASQSERSKINNGICPFGGYLAVHSKKSICKRLETLVYHCQPAEQTMKMGNKTSNIYEVKSISFAPETLQNQITLSPMPKQSSKVPHFQEGTFQKHIYGTSPAYSTKILNSIKVTQQMSAVIHTFMHVAHKALDGHLYHEQQCQAP
jgi:hypothetical protein